MCAGTTSPWGGGRGRGTPRQVLGDLGVEGFYGLFLYFPWLLQIISLAKKEKTVCKDKGKASPLLGGRKGRGSGAFRTAPDVTDLPRRGPSWADLLINPCRCAHRGGEVTAPKRTCRRPRAGDGRLHSPQRRASQEAPPPRSPADGEGAAGPQGSGN